MNIKERDTLNIKHVNILVNCVLDIDHIDRWRHGASPGHRACARHRDGLTVSHGSTAPARLVISELPAAAFIRVSHRLTTG